MSEQVDIEQLISNAKRSQGWTDDDIQRVLKSRSRCNLCSLCNDPNTGFVKVSPRFMADRFASPEIMVVGEAPGYDESREGVSFIGKAAQHGFDILSMIGMDPSKIHWTNATRCFPHEDGYSVPSPRTPDLVKETVPCSAYLFAEIATLKPKVIIALGGFASQVLIGPEVSSVTRAAGTIHNVTIRGATYSVLPCVHFSANLRSNGKHTDSIAKVFQLAKDMVTDDTPPVETIVLNNTDDAVAMLKDVRRRYQAGEFPAIAFDLEYDVPVFQETTRAEQNRLSSMCLYDKDRKLTAFSIAFDETFGYSVPLYTQDSLVDCEVVQKWLRVVLSEVPIICHNYMKAEGPWCKQKLGVTPILYFDSMLGSFSLYMKTRPNGLKPLMQSIFGWPGWDKKVQIYLQGLPVEQRSFKNVPLSILGLYSAIDAVAAWKLFKKFSVDLTEEDLWFPLRRILHRASRHFMDIELRGAFLDDEYYKRVEATYPVLCAELLDKIREVPQVKEFERLYSTEKKPVVYNPGSTDDVQKLLYCAFGADPVRDKYTRLKESPITGILPVGATEVGLKGHETFVKHTMWITSSVNGQRVVERRKIIDADRSMVAFKEPLRYQHINPMIEFESRSVAEPVVAQIMQRALCACQRDEDEEGGDETCSLCNNTGIKPEQTDLFNFLKLHRDYKKINKVISTYVGPIRTFVVPGTERIVFNYLLHGTDTGRLSSNSINMQNLPRQSDIRRLFVSEWKDKGGLIVSMDQSQAEMRLLAAVSNDPLLIETYLICPKCRKIGALTDGGVCSACGSTLGDDIHMTTATQIFGVKPEQVTKDMRVNAKTVSFGIAYGIGADGLAQKIGKTKDEAKEMIESFYKKFKGVQKYVKDRHSEYLRVGYVRSMLGRRLWLEHHRSGNKALMARGKREAQNYPIQSVASDLTLLGMMIAKERMVEAKMKSVPWEFTHDSVEFDVYPGELFDVLRIGKSSMETGILEEVPNLPVPLMIDSEIGVRWDGTVTVLSLKDNTIKVKGKRMWYDETVAQLRKTYAVSEEVIEEKVDKPPSGLKVLQRSSYQGETGGPTTVIANLTLTPLN